MTVGQSEWPEAADVCELQRKDNGVLKFISSLRRSFTAFLVSDIEQSFFLLQNLICEFTKKKYHIIKQVPKGKCRANVKSN